jgi:hypothetical protein
MVRVKLEEIAPTGGYSAIVEMAAVPREGESIAVQPGGAAFTIRSVIWVVFDHREYDVVVRFR